MFRTMMRDGRQPGVRVLVSMVLCASVLIGLSARVAGAATSTRWSVTATEIADQSVSAVACAAPRRCVVLGNNATGSVFGEVDDGVVSALQGSPLANALTCHPVSCVSVGGSVYGFRAERQTPTGWKRMPLSGPSSRYGEALMSVACDAATDCFAVGNSDARTDVDCPTPDPAGVFCDTALPVLERWSGQRWRPVTAVPVPVTAVTAVPVPSGEPFSSFNAVACAADRCVVVGEVWAGTTVTQAFSDTLTSSGWTLSMIPLPAMASTATLASVSCARVRCMAVGSATIDGTVEPFAVDQWHSRWSNVSPAEPVTAALSSVSCTATEGCLAVGSSATGRRQVPLIERWTAGHWSHVTAAPPPGSHARGGSSLLSVSCLSRTCTAVGNYGGTTRRGYAIGWLVEQGPP